MCAIFGKNSTDQKIDNKTLVSFSFLSQNKSIRQVKSFRSPLYQFFPLFFQSINISLRGMGKKPLYLQNQNIRGISTIGKRRVGHCIKCGKQKIRSNRWGQHSHADWSDISAKKKNKQFLEQFLKQITLIMSGKALQLLNKSYPDGIAEIFKRKLLAKIQAYLLDFLAFDRRVQRQQALIPRVNPQKTQQFASRSTKRNFSFKQKVAENNYQDDFKRTAQAKNDFMKYWKDSPIKKQVLCKLEESFEEKQYFVKPSSIKLGNTLKQLNEKKISNEKLKLMLSKASNQHEQIQNLLKKCYSCQQFFQGGAKKYRQCRFCKTRIHLYCIYRIGDSCTCNERRVNKIIKSSTFAVTYDSPQDVQNAQFLQTQHLKIKSFAVKTKRQILDQAQGQIINILYKRSYNNYSLQALSHNQHKVEPDIIYDPFLRVANAQIQKAYQQYISGDYKAPIKLIELSKSNYGIQALEDIPEYTLICEYSCDILPMICSLNIINNDKVMIYYNGSSSSTELVLAPVNCSNWAPLINHANTQQAQNCSSLRLIISNKIRVIIYSSKKILKKQQLLYNYNGAVSEYPTHGFFAYKKQK